MKPAAFFFFLATLFLASCQKENLQDPANNASDQWLSMKIDGVTISGSAIENLPEGADMYYNRVLTLPSGHFIQMFVPLDMEPGTYTFPPNGPVIMYCDPGYAQIADSDSTAMTILSNDQEQHRIVGTFSCRLVNVPENDTMRVTDGLFIFDY